MVSALSRKLWRDLNRLKGQVLSIALVVACGIASFVTMQSTYDSLLFSRDTYYARSRFADVFAHLESAPEALRHRLEAIPGVAQAHTRIVESAMVPMPEMPRPASGTIVSLPPNGDPPLNAVYLEKGRMLDPSRTDEVLLLEGFATAHAIDPGDRIPAVINGTLRELRVVGIARSAEYLLTMAPGDMTVDPKRLGVLWMNHDAVAAAFRHEGAFNDVVLELQPGASEAGVLAAVDGLLEPYGGVGAIPRAKQMSNFLLDGELLQLESMATVVPFIFLFVAAFLLNVVLSRLVMLQRPQIATLKAVGYSDRDVAMHYLKLVTVIVIAGATVGIAGGAYLGDALTGLYTGEFFRFPMAEYRLGAQVAIVAVAVSLAAAVVGALAAARRVSQLPPAEAMRPPAPANYRRTLLERLGLFHFLGPAARMVLREVQRRPLRVLLSSVGIAMAIGIVVVSRFMVDGLEQMIDVQFHRAMREDLSVTFAKPLPERSVRELEQFPGVFRAEGLRTVAVRFRAGHRSRDAAIIGYPQGGKLRRLLDRYGKREPLAPDGMVMSAKLGEILGVGVGDTVEAELREGDRETRQLLVAGLVDDAFGLQAHMRRDGLHRVLGEDNVVNSALLRIDRNEDTSIQLRLKQMPWVVGVSSPRDFQDRFNEQSGDMIAIYTFILTLFASIIAVGVIYNNTRVALSQRSRDLASLRVLGFRRAEIAAILFGEQAIQVVLAIPIGLVVGYYMVVGLMSTIDPETYRLPITISYRTYVFASLVAVGSAVASALLVRRKLNRLDLIGVLKTRE